jgi:ferrous iron transport protein B
VPETAVSAPAPPEGAPRYARPGKPKIALVGNPNVGKSVIFNRLTGQYVYVSNYPGTTVALARGTTRVGGKEYEVVDTPGVNSLVPQSEDERVTRDILLEERPDIVLVVADAKNLRRTLLLLSQVVELGLPTALDLNMADESHKRGIEVDVAALRQLFGIPVVETVATEGHGLGELERALERPKVPHNPSPELDAVIGELGRTVEDEGHLPLGLFAEWLYSQDEGLKGSLRRVAGEDRVRSITRGLATYQEKHRRPAAAVIVQTRTQWIDSTVGTLRRVRPGERSAVADRLGRWCREPLTGFPILIGVLLFMYYFVGAFGAGTAVDFLEETVFGEHLVPGSTWVIDRVLPIAFVRDLLVGPYGVISMGITY